jgi:RIP metalloprotease RseP
MGPVVMIVGVLLMVIIHEAGHFIAAKAFNMKATEAFFGFGPRLWSTTRGETEYGVKAIPLGGYVRIIGMNPFEEVAPEDEGRTYREKPFWQKSVVVLAGIASHFVVAYLLFFALAVGFGNDEPTTEVDAISTVLVIPDESEHAVPIELGITEQVISVDGMPFASIDSSSRNDGAPVEVVVDRDGVIETFITTDSVVPTPALTSGLQRGDVLVAVDGNPVETWDDFVVLTHERPDETTTVDILRNGEPMSLTTTFANRPVDGEPTGFFGVAPGFETVREGVLGGLVVAGTDVWFATVQSVKGLGGLVTNFGDLVGATFNNDAEVLDEVRPISAIGLTRVADTVKVAVALLALVNVFVGVLNVVPLYPLDGGHFAVALYERIRGRSADVRKLLPVAAAVFAFIVVLGVLGFYFDIVNPIDLGG